MNALAHRRCIPCSGGVPLLDAREVAELQRALSPGWSVIDQHHLQREFLFEDFRQALDFTNRVGELAEREGHHPDIHLGWGRVKLEIWTHKVDGLTENDFVLAAKVDRGVAGAWSDA